MSEKKDVSTEEIFARAIQNHQQNKLQLANKFYNETLKQNPNHLGAYNNLGILHNQLGQHEKAKDFYKKIIEIQPYNADAYFNLGNTFKILRQPQEAISFYEKAIKIKPNYVDAHYNLGNTLRETGKYQQSISSYEKVIKINSTHIESYNNLGILFNELQENQKAIDCYEKAIQINPNFESAYNNLGNIYKDLGEFKKSIKYYEKTIQINHNNIDAHNNLGNILKELGEHQKAMNYYQKAIQIEPNNLTAHWLSMNNFPVIYKNSDEINTYEEKFEKYIQKINQLLDTQTNYTKKNLISAMNSSTNFYLHYQGKNFLKLQQQYANLIERITRKIYQEFHVEKKIVQSKHIKIGFVSSLFKNHTIAKLFKNWTIKLNKDFFKKYIYYVDNKFDPITEEIKKNANFFFSHTNLDNLINQISKDDLDILIYIDIGMVPKIQILSSLRLAPIQCTTWGHPVTSGFKNIDYYLSSKSMEDNDSQKHYSEKLINLPYLAINYDFPNLSNIKKVNISNKSKATIFLNHQSLFKLLPQDDHIYLDIIKKHPNSFFWFLDGLNNSITNIFKDRISKLFQENGYDFKRHSYFHPRCDQDEFLGLINESDIILDSINWSGGNTSLEAISLNKPIVTYPSSLMRGRHTYGILKILGIEETIANSKNEYVEIAVKLARDINFKKHIINKIKNQKNKLYNNDKPIRFLEDFILKKFH